MASQADHGRPGPHMTEYLPGSGFRRLLAELLGEPPRAVWSPPSAPVEAPTQQSPVQPAAQPLPAPSQAQPVAVDRLGIAWRGKYWILLAAIVAGGGAYLGCALLPPTYQSSATLRVVVQSDTGVSEDAVLAANDLAVQYVPLVSTAGVIDPVAQRIGLSPGKLSASISSGTVGDQNLMSVSAQAGSQREAQLRANAVARQFVTYIRASNRRQTAAYSRLVGTTLSPIENEITRLQSQLGRGSDAPIGSSSSVNGAQATLATLLTARQQAAANLAQGVASSQPAVDLVAQAGAGTQIQPKPMLYALVTALAAFLLTLQLVVVVGARRLVAAAR